MYKCKKVPGPKPDMNKSQRSNKDTVLEKGRGKKRNFQEVMLRRNGGVNTRLDYKLQPSYLVSFSSFCDVVCVNGVIPVDFFSPFHAGVSLAHCTKHC